MKVFLKIQYQYQAGMILKIKDPIPVPADMFKSQAQHFVCAEWMLVSSVFLDDSCIKECLSFVKA